MTLDELVRRYPNREVRYLYRQFLDEEIPSHDDRIREILGSYEDHLELVRSFASCFLPETTLSKGTGYEFRFTEPLSEKNVKNFDMLITERKNGRVLFVESKTFTGSVTTGLLKDNHQQERWREHEIPSPLQGKQEIGH